MPATALINIDVDDLGRGIQFYTTAFGLKVGRRLGPTVIELLGAGAPIYLIEKPPMSLAAPTTTDQRRYGRHWTPVHLDFVVPDIEEALRQAMAAGAILEVPTVTNVWGKIAHLADPFGHGICVIEFVGHGYDEIAANSN